MNDGSGQGFLHVVPDEKFIDAAYRSFETAAPGRNRFIVIGGRKKLNHIRTFEPDRMSLRALSEPEWLAHLSEYDAVFIHFLWGPSRILVRQAPESVKFVWIGWGSDYYHLLQSAEVSLLLPQTSDLRRRVRKRILARLRNLIRATAAKVRHPILQIALNRKAKDVGADSPGESRLLERISFFAPVLPSEYERVAEAVPGFRARYLSWNYELPFDTNSVGGLEETATDILVGNSATWENNHLEAFELLAGRCHGRRIISPLAYGDRAYGQEIEREGFRHFGPFFKPLKDFQPHHEYLNVLRSCSIVVMNHVRQQGLGNILLMLALGARVFLRKENPIFDFLVEKGAHIFDVAMLPDELELDRSPLEPELVRDNRRITFEDFGRDSARLRTSRMLDIVTGEIEA